MKQTIIAASVGLIILSIGIICVYTIEDQFWKSFSFIYSLISSPIIFTIIIFWNRRQ